jgi:hypothetical protein
MSICLFFIALRRLKKKQPSYMYACTYVCMYVCVCVCVCVRLLACVCATIAVASSPTQSALGYDSVRS